MSQMTIDEAREALSRATAHYQVVEAALAESVAGEGTPERVLRQVELQAAQADAARELIAAKAEYEATSVEAAHRRRVRAVVQLAEVEAELTAAVAEAERAVDVLAEALAGVLNLSKKRYGYRQEADGRAPRTLLARSSVFGWLSWRLQRLELPDLDNPPRHYRSPLAELLGLGGEEEEVITAAKEGGNDN